MLRYILKRLLMLIPVTLGVSFLIYGCMELAAGDPISMIAPDATGEAYEALKIKYGYDKSVFYRYFLYISNFLRGDLGTSISMNKPVLELYMTALPNTIQLAVTAVIFGHLIAIPLGIISAVKRGTVIDNCSLAVALVGVSMPNFWAGLLLILMFSLGLGWLPSYGNTAGIKSLILPAITLGLDCTASLTRTTRSSLIDIIHQDYLHTARVKGVSEKIVIIKHALKNALIPILTVSGMQLGGTLGGSIVTETVFAWPGVGRLLIEAINQRDVQLATGCILMTTILKCLIQLVVDVLYAYVDPRIKAQSTRGKKKA
ncbi:MAG: ABC transporter permease [Lachnospiraceae bacterium]|nr:ABC transporter permease [Lachnospiraceae bacterium]